MEKEIEDVKKLLEEILNEINEEKKASISSRRTGDYRIGLSKAGDIVNDKLTQASKKI